MVRRRTNEPVFTKTLELDMGTVVPSLAGPKRPQDKVALPEVDELFNGDLKKVYGKDAPRPRRRSRARTTTSAMATW